MLGITAAEQRLFSQKTEVKTKQTGERAFPWLLCSRAPTWFSWGALGPHLSLCPRGASPSLRTHWPRLDGNLLGDSCNPRGSHGTGGTWKGKRKPSWHSRTPGLSCFDLYSIVSSAESNGGAFRNHLALQRRDGYYPSERSLSPFGNSCHLPHPSGGDGRSP